MKARVKSLALLVGTAIVFTACSKDQIAYRSEYDDLYFTSSDRTKMEASNQEFFDQNFSSEYKEPLAGEKIEDFEGVNYSSKTINPEYIAKYTSEYYDEDVIESDSPVYYEEQDLEEESGVYDGDDYNWEDRYRSRYGYSGSYTNAPYYDRWGNSPWGAWPNNSGSLFSANLGFGYGGSQWYNPYSYYPDPYSYYSYPYSNNSYYSYPGSYYWPSYYPNYGGGIGYYSGFSYYTGYGSYYPSTYVNTNRHGVNDGTGSTPVAIRNTVRAPRSSRGSVPTDYRQSKYRRTTDNNKVYVDRGSTVKRNTTNVATSSNDRNNYYRRTRTSTRTTNDANTRSSQSARTRSYNDSREYATRTRSVSGYNPRSRNANSVNTKKAGFFSGITNSGNTYRRSSSYNGRGGTRSSYNSGSRTNRSSSFSTPRTTRSTFSTGTRSSGGASPRRKN